MSSADCLGIFSCGFYFKGTRLCFKGFPFPSLAESLWQAIAERAQLFESRLALIGDLKIIEVFISLDEMYFKADIIKPKVKKRLSKN